MAIGSSFSRDKKQDDHDGGASPPPQCCRSGSKEPDAYLFGGSTSQGSTRTSVKQAVFSVNAEKSRSAFVISERLEFKGHGRGCDREMGKSWHIFPPRSSNSCETRVILAGTLTRQLGLQDLPLKRDMGSGRNKFPNMRLCRPPKVCANRGVERL